MMSDYSVFYKTQLPVDGDWPPDLHWDVFISAFNSSDRVETVFARAAGVQKHWLVFPEYEYEDHDLPRGDVYSSQTRSEAEFILGYMGRYGLNDAALNVCIDVTGFIKPYAMFLIRELCLSGVKRLDVIYSEPTVYAQKEDTKFSDERVQEVRQVAGFEGVHRTEMANDLLVINAGYDHELIMQVAANKDHARKSQVFGFPPLQPDMYQGNVLRAQRAAEAVGVHAGSHPSNYFAPANDPFITACVLSDIVREESSRQAIDNLYLCPLATEAQALGFTIYYLTECQGKAVSMIYPFCHAYPRSTSQGVSRIWKYTVEFP